MNYHISTTLILDNFKKYSECPLCDIYGEVEARVLEQFQGEAVMLDDFRARVNKKGFCEKHFHMLEKGENKLGAALQTHTRLSAMLKNMPKVTNPKNALAAGARMEEQLSGCAVCELIEDNMRRYYETIPKLYAAEEGFDGMYRRGKGFCMRHYAMLLEHAKFAKQRAAEFAEITDKLQRVNLERVLGELDRFCNAFDYRNRGVPLGVAQDALARAVAKIHGKR